jgi:hypothetical protein
MNISSDGDLLAAAAQSQSQRLLFAFARAELPPDANERQCCAGRRDGVLTPVMCVDKTVSELGSFEALVAQSRHTGAH